MKKRILKSLFIMLFLLNAPLLMAYDNEAAHPKITDISVDSSCLKTYLPHNLGGEFSLGYESKVNGKSVIEWIRAGSIDEDKEDCRRANHMHDPTLPWDVSFMSDEPLYDAVILGCYELGWLRYSNVTWATSYYSPAPYGETEDFMFNYTFFSSPFTWDRARDHYYYGLTSLSNAFRENHFAMTFKTLGHVLHLLQDVSVPAHTRNDMQSHLYVEYPEYLNMPTRWFAQPYEHYVKDNIKKNTAIYLNPDNNYPTFTGKSVTKFWDTDIYDKTNPSTGTTIGLAEYTNANFFSDYTIFVSPLDWDSALHLYPHPAWSNVEEHLDIDPNTGEKTIYLRRIKDGDNGQALEHLAAANSYYRYLPSQKKRKGLYLDDKCHDDYARALLPRAVGYSAGLLDYFFRGNIEVSLPPNGIYAKVDNSGLGFTSIKLIATNVTTTGESMTEGTIQLVVKYKVAETDPFQSEPVTTSANFSYIVVPEKNNVNALYIATPTELNFDLSQDHIPLWATDVYLQVVYHGKLANEDGTVNEDGAVAVGFKDISEPTPIEYFNNMDRICINGKWYVTGSSAAYDALPVKWWDYWEHGLQDVYIKISPADNPSDASPTNYTFYKPLVEPGPLTFFSAYILSDYTFFKSAYGTMVKTNSNDTATHNNLIKQNAAKQGEGIKNQDENYPLFYSFRGVNLWGPGSYILDGFTYPNYTDPNYIPCEWTDSMP